VQRRARDRRLNVLCHQLCVLGRLHRQLALSLEVDHVADGVNVLVRVVIELERWLDLDAMSIGVDEGRVEGFNDIASGFGAKRDKLYFGLVFLAGLGLDNPGLKVTANVVVVPDYFLVEDDFDAESLGGGENLVFELVGERGGVEKGAAAVNDGDVLGWVSALDLAGQLDAYGTAANDEDIKGILDG